MNTAPRITLDPHVCGGRPCIRGLRIRVTDLLEMLAAGATQAEILEDFPYLEAADIAAALGHFVPSSGAPVRKADRMMVAITQGRDLSAGD